MKPLRYYVRVERIYSDGSGTLYTLYTNKNFRSLPSARKYLMSESCEGRATLYERVFCPTAWGGSYSNVIIEEK
jgi:hypothetical protein